MRRFFFYALFVVFVLVLVFLVIAQYRRDMSVCMAVYDNPCGYCSARYCEPQLFVMQENLSGLFLNDYCGFIEKK